jgi:hypothetical protein
MDQILENQLLANIKGSYIIKKYKKLAYLESFCMFRLVLRLRGTTLPPPKMVKSKTFLQNLNILAYLTMK